MLIIKINIDNDEKGVYIVFNQKQPQQSLKGGLMKLLMVFTACTLLLCQVFAEDIARQNQGVYGARPLGIVYDDVHNKAFLIASCAYSCFSSSDSGSTWSPAFPAESLKVGLNATDTVGWGGGAVELVSKNGLTLVHTQETGGSLWALVVSYDGGETWQTIYNNKTFDAWKSARATQFGISASSLSAPRFHTTYNNRIYVVFTDLIMMSADSCQTWSLICFPDSTAKTADNPDSTRIVYELDFVGTSGDTFYVTGTGPDWGVAQFANGNWNKMKTIYSTEDNGQSFHTLADAILINRNETNGGPVDTGRCFDIANTEVSPSGDTIIVSEGGTMINYGMMNGGVRIAVNYSSDHGATWHPMFYETPGNNRGNVKAFWDAALPSKWRVFLGSTRYADNLDTVMLHPDSIGYGEMGRTPESMDAMIPGAECWIGNSSIGPFVSKTGIDAKFSLSIEGLEGVSIYKIAQIPDHPDTVYLATHMGLAVTTRYTDESIPYADKWKPPYGNFGMFNRTYNLVAINPNRPLLVVATDMNRLSITTNGGLNSEDWSDATSRLVKFGGGGGVAQTDIAGFNAQLYNDNGGQITGIDFIGRDTILATFACSRNYYGGLIQSFDGGTTWSRNTNVPDSTCVDVTVARDAFGSEVAYLVYGASGGSNLFTGYFMKSSDNLASWTRIPLNLRNIQEGNLQNPPNGTWAAQKLEFAPGSLDTAFLIVASRYPAVSFNGLDTIYTMNPQQSNNNLMSMSAITVNKWDHDSIFFVQGKTIWAMGLNTIDGSDKPLSNITFNQYFNAMPGEIMYDIVFDDLTMSSSMGFFGVTQNVSSGGTGIVAGKKAPTALPMQITMNVTPSLLVNIQLPVKSHIKLSLCNIQGKVVRSLMNESCEPGSRSVQIHSEKLASGLYFVKLKAGHKSITKNVVILK